MSNEKRVRNTKHIETIKQLDTVSIVSEKALSDFSDNVIRGRRLTDQKSDDLAYAESMKTYTFDESFKEENKNDQED
jgi:hypothetical protein